ncbi:MAG: glycosyltransferase [Chloroflexi bacterium]|nr:MAG: glycosyltransferase [Chloroflexota bacterium]
MKLLVDLYPCQTASRVRGVGRYTLALTREMIRLRGSHEMVAIASPHEAKSFEELRQEFTRLLPMGNFLPYYHPPLHWERPDIESQSRIATAFIHQAYQSISADAIFYPGFIDGYSHLGISPTPEKNIPSAKRVTVLYDLIPYIFHEQYLDRNIPGYKAWYLEKLNGLKQFDLFLAISESTRQDAIRLLEISPEKVVNISGAVGPEYRQLRWDEPERAAFLQSFGITRPFVLYIGGDDFRKNKEGLLRAYAQLPRHILDSHQLVINAVDNQGWYAQHAHLFRENDVVIINYVTDEQLVKLYNLCKLFVFPSLYEGFGLPALEAMACGAPVIASNNSSIPEVVGRSDILFDASDTNSITHSIEKVLTDDQFRQELSSYGLERVKQFSWELSAQRAWKALESLEQKSPARKYIPVTLSTPKPKIAYFSPLPPEESGISAYSADLLPHLAKYFDIDLFVTPGIQVDAALQRQFDVFPRTELLERRGNYATVVYHHGNSTFHSHMFEMEQKFPGVVVLHDFFLSHLVVNDNFYQGLLPQKLEESHGLSSVLDVSIRGFRDAAWDWPINWPVLRNAQELIVHSHYHDRLLQRYYGQGWNPRPTVIKQLRSLPGKFSEEQRMVARQQLGFQPNEFIFCAFGFLSPAKLNALTIEAFGKMQEQCNSDVRLIFVGGYGWPEPFESETEGLIVRLNLQDKIRVTGFVSRDVYENYLLAADAGIQLRTNSLGETSRAVLDCMAYALPTILNSHATLEDYNEEDVVKLPEYLDAETLAQAMCRLYKDEDYRSEKSRNALNAIREYHDPEKVAAAYAEIIYRAAQTSNRRIFAPALEAMAQRGDPDTSIRAHARVAAANLSLRNQPRVLVDVTATFFLDSRTGIQRVVKNLSKEFLLLKTSRRFGLIHYSKGSMYNALRFAEKIFDLAPSCLPSETVESFWPGDILFLADSDWELIPIQFSPLIEQVRRQGGKIASMVYDLLPIKHPDRFPGPMHDLFVRWLDFAIMQSDMLICISRAVADEVVEYIDEKKLSLSRRLDVNYIHLGADILVVQGESTLRKHVRFLVERQALPMFLMVGTLEPRKGHAFVLDAFEQLWEQGKEVSLCFAGKIGRGWGGMEALEQRIRDHPQSRRRFFFIENPSDAEINALYAAATAVITASIAEGFGLPIVEGALQKVPVLASDIPVFREVGGEGAMYFSLGSPTYLAEAVKAMLALSPGERQAMVEKIEVLTWKESAEWTLEVLEGQRVYKSLRPDSH